MAVAAETLELPAIAATNGSLVAIESAAATASDESGGGADVSDALAPTDVAVGPSEDAAMRLGAVAAASKPVINAQATVDLETTDFLRRD